MKSPTYSSFSHMLDRCFNPRHERYPRYGGRGITVCDRWNPKKNPRRAFQHFLADMGERPEGMTLDRIDNDGNYEPGNCRWATSEQQYATRTYQNPRPTHCLKGHEFTPANTYVAKSGFRHCKACQRLRMRERYRKDPEAARLRTALWRQRNAAVA